jgi:hypothetical protein
MKKKVIKGFVVTNRHGGILLESSRLPIYWLKSMATEFAKNGYYGKVLPCEIILKFPQKTRLTIK